MSSSKVGERHQEDPIKKIDGPAFLAGAQSGSLPRSRWSRSIGSQIKSCKRNRVVQKQSQVIFRSSEPRRAFALSMNSRPEVILVRRSAVLSAVGILRTERRPSVTFSLMNAMIIRKCFDFFIRADTGAVSSMTGALSSKTIAGNLIGRPNSRDRFSMKIISVVNVYRALISACVEEVAINVCFTDLE